VPKKVKAAVAKPEKIPKKKAAVSKVVEVKAAAAKPEKSLKKKAAVVKVVKAEKEVAKKVKTTATPTKEKTAPAPYTVRTRSAKKAV
jgi:hypothetical protein